MKKIISIIAATAMLMSFTTAFAANADNMQEVLVSVKSRIDVPEEYSEFSSNQHTISGSENYNFSWRTKEGGKSINVTAYSDGIISNYSKYTDSYRSQPAMSTMDTAEAKTIAEDFVKNINSKYPYEIKIGDADGATLYSDNRYFPIEVYINGVVLLNDGGSVSVNTKTGEVTDFNIWYVTDVEIDFTSSDEFINEEEAKAAYSGKLGLKLVYRSYYDDNKEIFYPVYVQNSNYNQYINALTGEIEEADYYLYDRGYGATMEMATASSKEADLTPQELEEIDNINGLISKTDIEQKLKNNELLSIPSDLKVNSINLHKDTFNDTYIYRVYMNNEKDDGYEGIYASVDAKTGEIIDFSHFGSNIKDDAEPVRRDDHLFEVLAGTKTAEYTYDEDRHQYQRYVNGIDVEGDFANITYSGDTLTSYYINYSNADFPSIDNAMSNEEAEKAFFNQTDYSVKCLFKPYKDDKHHITPVYAHEYGSINPFTGKLVNYRNEEITGEENASITYSDISGHYAEKYINALAEYGIGFEGNEFKPDERITQADLLTLLTSVTGGGDIIVMFDNKEQADYAYLRAIRNSIITGDERDDNAVITRETASIYLIRAIGAEEYAKYNDIYVTPFDDVTENKGYIALLNAMGVVHGDGGHFNPKREITRAEFAVMLYNYLNR